MGRGFGRLGIQPGAINALASDGELLEKMVGFYERTLAGSEAAIAYLAHRGLDDEWS